MLKARKILSRLILVLLVMITITTALLWIQSYKKPPVMWLSDIETRWSFFCAERGSVTFAYSSDRLPPTLGSQENYTWGSRESFQETLIHSDRDALRIALKTLRNVRKGRPTFLSDSNAEQEAIQFLNKRRNEGVEHVRGYMWRHSKLGFFLRIDNQPSKAIAVQIPLWFPTCGGALGILCFLWRGHRLKRYLRIQRGQCVSCEYNLTGITSGRCPECGIQISRNQAAHLYKNRQDKM